MHALTFACPQCGRRMGVGPEMAGRPVRCPHCKQVIVAPATDGGAAAPAPAPSHAAPTPMPTPLPDFDLAPRERAESIFSEHADEESLFESAPPAKIEMPDELPGLVPTDLSIKLPAQNGVPAPAADPPPADAAAPTKEPFSPWGKLDGSDPEPTPQPAPAAAPPPPAAAVSPPPVIAPPTGPRVSLLLLVVVSLYAAAATAAAVWGLLRGGDRGNPLLFVPDFLGQYQRAKREKVSDLRAPLKEMGWDEKTIPPELRVKLGGRLAVGDLLVEPLGVAEKKLNRVTVFNVKGTEPQTVAFRHPCLVLTLRLTNTSKDLVFHPTDPAYNRKELTTVPPPLTGVVVDDRRRFYGGPVVWPFGLDVKRVYVDGQDGDEEPLAPGKAREYAIPSDDRPELIDAVAAATAPVTWQVHLRRGVTRLRWEDVSVGALVGVEFGAAAVKRLPVDKS